MFKLESNRLKREFKITNDNFYASQIYNKCSGMGLIPDGNGSEFLIRFQDGELITAKGLSVVSSSDDNGVLSFTFAETQGVSVTLKYWVHEDGNTICKQIILSQSDERIIDYVFLENIGIINSETHFGVERVEGGEISEVWAALGQPFYIDSLFFGCEFPAVDSRIVHGAGRIKYYIGKNVGRNFACPVTVMGGGKDNTIADVKKAFFEYIDFISCKNELRFNFNTWYDKMRDINEESVKTLFTEFDRIAKENGAPKIKSYVVDDGWVDLRADFWKFNKKFPNGMSNISALCSELGSSFGMWLSPRGGYYKNRPFAKKMEKAGNGYLNEKSNDICIASSKYVEKLGDFLVKCTKDYAIDYWKLDGFCLAACPDESHDHAIGGDNGMYFYTDMWSKWIKLFERLRSTGENGKNMWINMTCYVNPSPWWLQWVNSLWIQNSNDIGFAKNQEDQSKINAEMTYRDGRYYDLLCRRSAQVPLKALYNHEPIYGNSAKVSYGDEEFERYLYWCAIRGQALNELHFSLNLLNAEKWASLAKVMRFQEENFHILKNALFIGGNPEENNIYGFFSWSDEGEGIIALRNPTNEDASLTLTFNKLMGAPEDLKDVRRENILCDTMPENEQTFSYNDKLDIRLEPFEMMILKFTK